MHQLLHTQDTQKGACAGARVGASQRDIPTRTPAHDWVPQVYFVEGTALEQRDLVRAGVLGVDKAIILSGATGDQHDAAEKKSGSKTVKHARISEEAALGRLMDADSIFTFRSICTARPTANIVCQIKNSDNITYLMVEDREGPGSNGGDGGDITLCPPFAAGHVFLSSVLDRLTAQVFYNGHLMPILRELVISGGANSNNFHETDVQPSVLYSLAVPSSFTGKTYQELFQYLVSKRASLPLGLFRLRPTDDVSPLPYVITNPHATLVLNSDDRMFTLLAPDNILSSPLGVLSITVVEAHIPAVGDKAGAEPNMLSSQASADELLPGGTCFCVIQSQGESKTSHLCRNNVDPHWNFQAEFFVIDMEGAVEVAIYDRCRPSDGDSQEHGKVNFVGSASLSVSEVTSELASVQCRNLSQPSMQGVRDEWFKLDRGTGGQNKVQSGSGKEVVQPALVRLHLRWFPAESEDALQD